MLRDVAVIGGVGIILFVAIIAVVVAFRIIADCAKGFTDWRE